MTFFQSPGAESYPRNLLRAREAPRALFVGSSVPNPQNKAFVLTLLAAGVMAVCAVAALFVMPLAGQRAGGPSSAAGEAAIAEAVAEPVVQEAAAEDAASFPAPVAEASQAAKDTAGRVAQPPMLAAGASGAEPAAAEELSTADPRWSLATGGVQAPPDQAAEAAQAGGGTADFVVVSDVNAAEVAAAADSRGDEPVIVVDEAAAAAVPETEPVPADSAEATADAAEPSDDGTTAAIPQRARTAAKGGGRSGRVTSAVNMRAGPDNRSRVLGVIPARASIRVIGCKYWCNVEYDGRRGYIFKSFVR